eukprot:scpid92797/ scgid16344/ 
MISKGTAIALLCVLTMSVVLLRASPDAPSNASGTTNSNRTSTEADQNGPVNTGRPEEVSRLDRRIRETSWRGSKSLTPEEQNANHACSMHFMIVNPEYIASMMALDFDINVTSNSFNVSYCNGICHQGGATFVEVVSDYQEVFVHFYLNDGDKELPKPTCIPTGYEHVNATTVNGTFLSLPLSVSGCTCL